MSSEADKLIAAARERWLKDEFEEALTLFRNATALAPNDLRLAVEFASYLGLRCEVDEALHILSRCEQALAGNNVALYQVGLAYERAFSPDLALRCFQHVVRDDPSQHLAWIKIAEWYDRRGFVEEAVAAIDHASDDFPDAALAKSKLYRREGKTAEAKYLLEQLTTRSDVVDRVRIAAWYELAVVCDAEGHSRLAWDAVVAGKALQHREAARHLKHAQDLAKLEASFVTTVTDRHYRSWADNATHPSIALLTGSPRSGTTLMARVLGNHDAIDMADEINAYATYAHKEMLRGMQGTSAGEVLTSIPKDRIANCQSRYRRWMYGALGREAGEATLLDKNPSTTFLIPAFRRMFPHATIIMAIRDPRDVIVSCFLQQFPLNPVSAMFSRIELAVMRCRAEIEAWMRLRDKLTQPWCEIRYEQLASGNEQDLSNALQALGLAPQNNLLDFQSSLQTSAARSPTYAQLFEPLHTKSIGRWQRYEEQLRPYLAQLEPVCRQLGYS